jgi:glycosyltransferase involved in cell wall biosynthesis
MANIEYSVVIPIFNEAENLPELASKLSDIMTSLGQTWELLFVDDGSTDDGYAVAQGLQKQYPQIRLLKFDRNYGQTAATAAGIQAAAGNSIITLDADLQNDPADIPKLVRLLPGHDAVVGWRHKRQDTFVKRVSSKIANWIRNTVTQDSIRDTGCSLKVFRAEVLKKIPLFEGMHRFLPTLVRMHGGTVIEEMVNHFPRTKGVSKYSISNRLWRSGLDLFAVRWMKWRFLSYRVIHEA